MKRVRGSLIAVAIAGAFAAGAAQAQVSDNVVKIGVLSDMSSLYTDLAGAGSVAAAGSTSSQRRLRPRSCWWGNGTKRFDSSTPRSLGVRIQGS